MIPIEDIQKELSVHPFLKGPENPATRNADGQKVFRVSHDERIVVNYTPDP